MLIDSGKLKQDIATVMPSRVEVNLIVDAQPEAVVRCKDCRKNGSFDCPLFTDAVEMEMDEDWFCADGERKDGDGE